MIRVNGMVRSLMVMVMSWQKMLIWQKMLVLTMMVLSNIRQDVWEVCLRRYQKLATGEHFHRHSTIPGHEGKVPCNFYGAIGAIPRFYYQVARGW